MVMIGKGDRVLRKYVNNSVTGSFCGDFRRYVPAEEGTNEMVIQFQAGLQRLPDCTDCRDCQSLDEGV